MIAALLVLLAAGRLEVPAVDGPTRGRYVLARQEPRRGLALPSHASHGWSQRARLLPTGETELTVISDPDTAVRLPPPPRAPDATAIADDVRRLSAELVDGSPDAWESSRRILTWVSLHVAHEDAPAHADDAADTLRLRTGSCVGRSLLSADLLRAAGIPARTVHGLLAGAGTDPPFLLHRFVESWIDGIGWVPSDPGESVHAVDARHVFIAVEDGTYDPESQRGLWLRVVEVPGSLAGARAAARPLVVARRPGPR